ncbi:MAG: MmcQ/YjbR family DNA-binding protein [Lachnospira sp.]|nr:MmcQ/YjbR family DNA-binding protein [Lachnospira sp.]
MDRESVNQYIFENYGVKPEAPWPKTPLHHVYRHKKNQKWFGIIMNIPRSKLGFFGEELIDVMNVKCDSDMILSLLDTKGYYPAYHMNKKHWISIVLNDELPDTTVKNLIDMSFRITEK